MISHDRVLHTLAWAVAVATFPLIFMGGLVTSRHAGMSVPDWPNSYGYNMFLFPPRLWVGGILYEHTHRLMATVVGMLSIALTIWAWRFQIGQLFGLGNTDRTPRSLRYLCLGVLLGVMFQGLLGGLRVVLVNLDLAIVHACFAQAFFCVAALTVLMTSRWWSVAQPPPAVIPARKGIIGLAVAMFIAVYLQLIVGATMRHGDAGLAIPDFPLAYGKILPPADPAGLAGANHLRAWNLNLDPVTLPQIWLHFAHRVGALVVLLLGAATVQRIVRRFPNPALLIPSLLLALLLLVQIALGVATVLLRKPADVASAHVAVGALVLVSSFVIMVRAMRLYRHHGELAFHDFNSLKVEWAWPIRLIIPRTH